jgi:hypothetical protein
MAENPELRERLAAHVRQMDFGDGVWHAIAQQTVIAYRAVLAR